jgi:uncharacterized membrane protein
VSIRNDALVFFPKLSISICQHNLETQLLDQAQKLRDLSRRVDEVTIAQTNKDAPQSKSEAEEKIMPPEETRVETVETELVSPLAETQVAPSETEKPLMTEPKRAEPQMATPSRSFISFEKLKRTEEWEALIGGNILNRIGALALIFGIGFFSEICV